jgi:biotin--protein ligase
MQVVGDRPLRFFDGIGEGCVYPGFRYDNENGACITRLSTRSERGDDELVESVYYNGGGHFVNAEKTKNTTVIAKYLDGDGEGKAAAVSCRVGQGVAVLWMVHPEFTLSRPPASLTPPLSQQHISEERLKALEDQRSRFMARSLQLLGLELPSSGSLQAVPLPQFLVHPTGSAKSLEALVERSSPSLSSEGGKDRFKFYPTEGCEDILKSARSKEYDPEAETQTHQIILCANDFIPTKEWTPHFNISAYLSNLAALKGKTGSTITRRHQIGESFLYGEVISSTQTQLDQ